MPETDRRCNDCENHWLEKAARRELGRWGFASNSLVKVAQWGARAGGLGLLLGILMALFSYSEFALLAWLPISILLLGFPLAGAAICVLPFARAAERGADLLNDDRKEFLLESKGGHQQKLLHSAPTDE